MSFRHNLACVIQKCLRFKGVVTVIIYLINGVRRVHMYVYFYWHTHDFGREYVDTYANLFPMVFQIFQNFSGYIILNCLKLQSVCL